MDCCILGSKSNIELAWGSNLNNTDGKNLQIFKVIIIGNYISLMACCINWVSVSLFDSLRFQHWSGYNFTEVFSLRRQLYYWVYMELSHSKSAIDLQLNLTVIVVLKCLGIILLLSSPSCTIDLVCTCTILSVQLNNTVLFMQVLKSNQLKIQTDKISVSCRQLKIDWNRNKSGCVSLK